MLAKELEQTLNNAFKRAREKRHEFMTVEHLLLALLDNESALDVLRACGAKIDSLSEQLAVFIEDNTPLLSDDEDRDTSPTLGFQRVLQRAVFHVQSAGNKEVTGANVLVAIFGEQESQAVFLMNQNDVVRLDVLNYISHGISKMTDDAHEGASQTGEEQEQGVAEAELSPLEQFATNLNKRAREGKIDPLIGRRY